MDEKDMRICKLEEEITRLRKREVELAEKLEDEIERLRKTQEVFVELRDKYTRLVGGIMQMTAKYGGGEADGTDPD